MAAPKVRQEGDYFLFSWETAAGPVECELGQVRQEREGLHAELTWRAQRPAVEGTHLHWARLNLASSQSRSGMAKELGRRAEGLEVPWYDLIEQVAVITKERVRTGEPFVRVGGEGMVRPRRWRLERLLEEGQLTVLYGEGGSGKSWLAVAIAMSVQDGFPILDLTPEPGTVVYLDYETDAEEIGERVRRFGRGYEMREVPEIPYRRMRRALADDIIAVKRFVAREGAVLVIVDSLGMACGGEPEAAEVVLRMFGAVRELGCTVLGIDHISAAMTEKRDKRRPFGSIYKVNLPRALWEVRSTEGNDGDFRVALYNRKQNNGRLQKPMGFRMVHTEDATYVEKADPRQTPELAEGLPLAEQIAIRLMSGEQDVSVLAESLDRTVGTIRTTLNRYSDRFIRRGNSWGLRDDRNVT